MDFAGFMQLALYHPELGYYRRVRTRIGYGHDTDFFTATTSSPVFGELVIAAARKLLGARTPEEFTFVEIGSETPHGILRDAPHSFAGTRTIGIGEPLQLAGRCVVFSNELFDAQPFRRFIYRNTRWREIGVGLEGAELVEREFEPLNPAPLPAEAPEGYRLDLPLAATSIAEQIAAPGWSGLFIAFDYGKSWSELVESTPSGTARAYHRHQLSNDLLARPGEQDLTCHVCWDWLADALTRNGFAATTVESQESFFVRHAADFIAALSASEAEHFSRRKQALLQLLHPAHLGFKFQVLHARRDL